MAFVKLVPTLSGLALSFISGAESALCPTGTVEINVTSIADVHNLNDVMNCTGEGDFMVTWYSNLTLDQTIEASNMKNVTVTGVGSPTIHGGLYNENTGEDNLDAGEGLGIFSVSDASTLKLSNLVLTGGNAQDGGAVNLLSSSSLFVYDCTFLSNNASNGGETIHVMEFSTSRVTRQKQSVFLVSFRFFSSLSSFFLLLFVVILVPFLVILSFVFVLSSCRFPFDSFTAAFAFTFASLLSLVADSGILVLLVVATPPPRAPCEPGVCVLPLRDVFFLALLIVDLSFFIYSSIHVVFLCPSLFRSRLGHRFLASCLFLAGTVLSRLAYYF